jgi:hypothetical protein
MNIQEAARELGLSTWYLFSLIYFVTFNDSLKNALARQFPSSRRRSPIPIAVVGIGIAEWDLLATIPDVFAQSTLQHGRNAIRFPSAKTETTPPTRIGYEETTQPIPTSFRQRNLLCPSEALFTGLKFRAPASLPILVGFLMSGLRILFHYQPAFQMNNGSAFSSPRFETLSTSSPYNVSCS